MAIAEFKTFHDSWSARYLPIINAVSYGEPPIVSAHFGDIIFENLLVLKRLLETESSPTEWEKADGL